MDSLRRLTSSVFDGSGGASSSAVGSGPPRVGRRHSGSGLSAFLPTVGLGLGGGDPLELTYVTQQLVVCGFPVAAPTNRKTNAANADELAHALETRHGGHYLVFNLNALDEQPTDSSCESPAAAAAASPTPSLMEQLWKKTAHSTTTTASPSPMDAHAIAEKLREQMLEFSWERDGMKAHTPPIDLVFRICYSIFAWLSLDAQNVAVVHCQTGKTRSGVVVACYLLFARLADDPIDAFVEFYRKRWDMRSLTPQALRSKTPPSIQRFLGSFHELIEYQKPPNDKPMLLKAIIFRALPVELRPCVQIWDDYRMVFCTDSHAGAGGLDEVAPRDPPVLDWSGDDGFLAILWENGVELDGGFSILCSFGDEYDSNGDDVDASSRVLFRYADSTWFLSPGLVTLTKSKLDMMKQYEHGFDDEQFSVDLVLHENSSSKAARRNHVRLDYTGNNAVRQGLIEITKHHMVLPDPAMHSNFIRMGFGETPTTFALQRSQNAPNVALDLLHSEGLAACFAKESPGKQSQDAGGGSFPSVALTQMPAGEPTMHPSNSALRRQTTAEIVAMQSQRSRYSIPTAVDSSVCQVCKDDDYMMRPQIVQCTGQCGSFYHTTCVGLRKIPFGLTTLSDRTNHGVYVKKFFSAWECDTCAPPPIPAGTAFRPSPTAIEVPPGMTLVPTAWASSYVPSVASAGSRENSDPLGIKDTSAAASVRVPAQLGFATSAPTSSFSESAKQLLEANRDGPTNRQENESVKLDKLRDFLLSSGVSVEDLLRAATTPNVSITPTPPKDQGLHASTGAAEAQSPSAAASSSSSSNSSLTVQTALHQIGEQGDNELKPASKGPTSSATRSPARSPSKQVELQPPSPHTRVGQHLVAAESNHVGLAVEKSDSKSSSAANSTVSRSSLMSEITSKAAAASIPPTAAEPQALDMKSALLRDIVAKRAKTSNEAAVPAMPAVDLLTKDSIPCSDTSKYDMMLKRGVPFEAVQNCMVKDGADPSTLQRLQQKESRSESQTLEVSAVDAKVRLRDVEEFKSYFSMLRLGCPKEAVKHKLIMDGLDPIIVDLGPEAIYDDVKDKITIVLPAEDRSRLQDDIKCVREPKSKRSSTPSEQPQSDNTATTGPEPAGEQKTTGATDGVLLRDHEVYAKYFKMLKMGLPKDAVRHKMRSEGADERALELGGDAQYSKLTESPVAAKLGDDPVYAKYFKMLKMGLPEGAVRHKMVTDGVDVKALELGPDALVTDLVVKASGGAASKPGSLQASKAKQRRKKLHWQAISEDRLGNLNQQTIWEDKGDDEVDFDMDMDELESLFFANNDPNSSSGGGKKKSSQAKALKRKQSVTLVDGKRAMNAAISLARVRLSYSAIAEAVQSFDAMGLSLQQLIGINEFLPTPEEVAVVTAYTGDIAMLGEVCPFLVVAFDNVVVAERDLRLCVDEWCLS